MFEIIIEAHPVILAIFFALFTLSIGSLLNVIIYRLPIMVRNEWINECHSLLHLEQTTIPEKINLFIPRSFCPHCKQLVPAWANIPLLSYLFLKGKCTHCKTAISFRYPFIEILTCLLSFFALWCFGPSLSLAFALLFIWLSLVMFFIDLDHQLLPDPLSLGLLWLGLLANTANLFTTLPNAVYSAAGAWLFLWLVMQLFYLLTGKIGMGHGDFKLFAAFGAWFGWVMLPLILLIASISGAIIGIIYLKINNATRDTPIPFGPFLCLAGLCTLFWGPEIMKWYLRLWM